jgi:hypothetical protein
VFVKNQRSSRVAKRRKRVKNPVIPGGAISRPFPRSRLLVDVPGVEAILQRARFPYVNKPLNEDESLNLICDAREDEPTYPIEKLLKKLKQ